MTGRWQIAAEFSNPKGDCVNQPRVARNELPWESVGKNPTPTGLWPTHANRQNGKAATALRLGIFLRATTQGSSCLATLGFGTESRWDSRMIAMAIQNVARRRRDEIKSCRTQTSSDLTCATESVFNPNGIATSSPRLARQRLPWVNMTNRKQPQRGCGQHHANGQNGMAATALRLEIFCGR